MYFASLEGLRLPSANVDHEGKSPLTSSRRTIGERASPDVVVVRIPALEGDRLPQGILLEKAT